MVTGKVPFDADTPVSVALKHMQEEPIPPIEENPNLPEALNKIILKAIKKDPILRYQTSTELLNDLKEALKNPFGDFVEETSYDATAKTQQISAEDYNKVNSRNKKENKFITFIKKHKAFSIFIGAILLFFLAFGATMLILNITNPKEVELPNLVGLSREEAEQKLKEVNLKFEVESEEYDPEVEEGHIISQDPAYVENYNNVKEGSTVKVKISKGTEKTIVPNVKGKEKDEAIQLIEDAKLKAEIIEETSKTVKEGYVVSQEINPDTEINAGETIKIHVSIGTGIKEITMVNVIGKSEADAKATLTALNLKVNIGYGEDNSKDNGVVLKQSVDVGTTIEEGTTITITVNKLAETKTATVTIDVKSLTGGYPTNDEDSTIPKTVNVELKYGDRTETRSGIDKNKNCTISISGKEGETKDIQITIKDSTGTLYSSSKSIKFGAQSEILFSK